jgi:hypothetical protein
MSNFNVTEAKQTRNIHQSMTAYKKLLKISAIAWFNSYESNIKLQKDKGKKSDTKNVVKSVF